MFLKSYMAETRVIIWLIIKGSLTGYGLRIDTNGDRISDTEVKIR
jgi:hypothetical protein